MVPIFYSVPPILTFLRKAPSLFSYSVGNGYVSARASPGLLPVSNGNSLGKVIPSKSPPPPPTHSTQLAANNRKPDLRVITSQSGKGLMHHLVSLQRDIGI